MYQKMCGFGDDALERLREANVPWFSQQLEEGNYVGWFLLFGGEIVGGGGLMLRKVAPVPGCYRPGKAGHIGNIYMEPAHRRRGVGQMLVETIVEWCRKESLDSVTLSTSEAGRRLYESVGFVSGEEMRLEVDI